MNTRVIISNKIANLDVLPSAMLEYMLQGLKRYSKYKNFEINMETYGERGVLSNKMAKNLGKNKEVCFGCAATCTWLEMTKLRPSKKLFVHREAESEVFKLQPYRKKVSGLLNITEAEFKDLEFALDQARCGDFEELLATRLPREEVNRLCDYLEENGYCDFEMDSDDWEEYVPDMEKVIEYLKSQGA